MRIISSPQATAEQVALARQSHERIGLVPTMGALHAGHMSLIERAKSSCDMVVCSIFVNPLQFNDPKDLERYPRKPEEDAAMLEAAGCDILFMPEKERIFADFSPATYDLGDLESYWEGPSRPGHFQGVVNVVERLFFYARPDEAFFGVKDRQQLTILQHVARSLRWPEQITACPTTREPDGLAMSSRNMRLNAQQRQQATILYRCLNEASNMAFNASIAEVATMVQDLLADAPGVELDHFGLADPQTLRPLQAWDGHDQVVALIAAHVGPVRLIDNITLYRKGADIGKGL